MKYTRMDRYCVLGNPVEHSKSPWIHARFAALTGQDMTYGKKLIALDGFAAAIAASIAAADCGPEPMNRIDRRFAELAACGRTALIPFVTAGDPQPAAVVPVTV